MVERHVIARFSVEAQSPLMIASGEEDALLDNLLSRDPNGLPILPGTSIAGVLRALLNETDEASALFGWQERDQGLRSKITVTDGLFHWSDDRPRDGLLLDRSEMLDDPVCRIALDPAPVLRDHVRLNQYGTVDGEGKFTRAATPVGARFTFELYARDRQSLDRIARLVRRGMWLGGAGRSGYGELMCIAEGWADLDLSTDEGWTTYCSIAGNDIGLGSPIEMHRPEGALPSTARQWRLEGQIESTLLIGAAGLDMTEDRAPFRETRIEWAGSIGSASNYDWVLPASAIKGPLRHRTLFHLRKAGVAEAEAAIDDLFGSPAREGSGHAGRMRFHDCRMDINNVETLIQHHVGLDRFTGGARRGVLFTDRMLWRPNISIRVDELIALSEDQHKALAAAFGDLARGLCGIGAEWGEGAGVFDGSVDPVIPEKPGATEQIDNSREVGCDG